MKEFFRRLWHFDEDYAEFELLETEQGEPGFFSGSEEKAPEQTEYLGTVSASTEENKKRLKKELRGDINTDLILRPFMLSGDIPALAAFMNGMADGDQINDYILRQGMRVGCMDGADEQRSKFAMEHVFALQEADLSDRWKEVKAAVLEGRTVVFIEGDTQAVVMDTRGFEKRNVDTAKNEQVIRGSQEGFVENLRTNITLLRRIIKTDDFVCELRDAGAENNIYVAIAYREGIVNQTLLEEVKRRLAKIDTTINLSSGIVEQLIEEHSHSPLTQILSTERPDRVAAHIMQGHVAVICEGSPYVNIMPATLYSLMSTSEDTCVRPPVGTIIRLVRYIGAVLSIILPGSFIALAMHHQGMLTTEVLTTIIASRRMVFLPLGVELLVMLFVFQLIREAGMRIPGNIGQAIGIIGGLILGQAAVAANMVSTIVLILVALTGLGNFTIAEYSTQVTASWFRILLVLAGWMGGLLGLFCVALLCMAWLTQLKSFGVPFLSPVVPKMNSNRPPIVRGVIKNNQKREDYMNTKEGRT